MKRRLALSSSALLGWPRTAPAQRRLPRIGVLPDAGPQNRLMLTAALAAQGWQEGRDYSLLELGLAYGQSAIEPAVQRMVAAQPDLLFTANTAYAVAARRHTTTLPIVLFASGYPVEAGLANSLAHPGGNVSGNTNFAGTGIWGKQMQLLREAKPDVRRIGVLWDYLPPDSPPQEAQVAFADMADGARQLGVSVIRVDVAHPQQLPAALARLKAARTQAVVPTTGSALWSVQSQVMRYAAEQRWPSIVNWRLFDTDDPYPLLVYAPTAQGLMMQAVDTVLRVLKDGVNIGEVPIQQPTRFELVVNLKMARAIGLNVPKALLLRADEVIQ